MKYDWLNDYLLAKKGVEKDFKVEWGWLRFKVDEKLFLAVCQDKEGRDVYVTVKVDPVQSAILRETYEDIIPGYYTDKRNWVSVKIDGNVPDEVVRKLADAAYELILRKLPKYRRVQITGEA